LSSALLRLGKAGFDLDWVQGLGISQVFDLLEQVHEMEKVERHDQFVLQALATQGDGKKIKQTAKDLKR